MLLAVLDKVTSYPLGYLTYNNIDELSRLLSALRAGYTFAGLRVNQSITH